MSYNGSGTFVINSTGQPVVTGTVISSSTFNSLTADLGTGLSTAITKDGQTTTTAKIPFAQGISAAVASNFAAGTVGAPSIYLSTDTTTGLYRIGANNVGFAVSGVKLLDLGSALVGITGALTVSTTLNVTGVATLGNGAVLGTPASGTVTNLTGTASININGTVGATTATTGAFTSGTFSTTLGVGGKTHIGSGSSGDSGGYLQIEQDTPTALMNIDFQMYNYSGATKMGGVRFYVQDLLRAQIDSYTDDFTAQGDLRFYTSVGGTMTQNMTLNSSGDLAITGQATASAIAGTAVATQANQETATSTTTAVSPGRQQFHPSAAKAWVRYQTVTTTTNIASYNVASLTDNGTGDTTITFTTNFSSGTSYNGVFSGRQDGNNINCVISAPANFASSTIRVTTFNLEAVAQARDYEIVSGIMFGDQ